MCARGHDHLGHLSPSRHSWGWLMFFEALPALSVFFLLLLALVPVRLPSYWSAGGLWPLLGVFYWSLVQPRLMPVLLVFAIGILCDLALNMALGCHALIFLLVHVLLTTQRRFLIGKGFWLVWPAFGLSVIGVHSLIFLLQHIMTATAATWHDWKSGLPAMATVTLAFPVLLPLLHGLQRLVTAQEN